MASMGTLPGEAGLHNRNASPPQPATLAGKTGVFLEMIKFQHTIFALPFALSGMLLAANGLPAALLVVKIVLACVFARTAAMSFNRWADAELDSRNPRTQTRAIPAGQLARPFVLAAAILSTVLFVATSAWINRLAFLLCPLAILVLLGYSYCKRFTSLAHFVLGLALGIAPIGAWVAVRAEIGLPAILLGAGVMLWTTGFDLIYACQDIEIDRREGLFSIPSRFGATFALRLSRILHIACLGCWVGAGLLTHLPWLYHAGIGVAALLLLAEHLVVDPSDTRKINLAFFTINSWVGMVILLFTGLALWLR